MGDDQRRPALHRLAEAEADPRLRRRVDRRGRVVEDEDARVHGDRARDGDSLALAARERDSALADDRVVALRQLGDELVAPARAARRDSTSSSVASGRAEGDVLAHGRGEEERVLRDDRDLRAKRRERDVAHVDAVDQHAPFGDVVEPRHERGQRRLPRPGVADDGHVLVRRDLEVDAVEHRPLRVVAERDALELRSARARPAKARRRACRRPPRARRAPGRCARPRRSRAATARSTCRASAAA